MVALDEYVLKLPDEIRWDDAAFLAFCRMNDEFNIERDAEGNIIIMSPTNTLSGFYKNKLLIVLGNWAIYSNLGYTFSSSAGFTLPDGSMRSPDASFILKARFDALSEDEKNQFAHIVPDFVAELRSKTDSLKKLQLKMESYIQNGVRLGWLIDLQGREAWIYRQNGTVDCVSFSIRKLSGEQVLPDFELDLSIFE
ncbi:MAG: Uma2 family endonuclease [Spirosomataceae bacterium]